MTKASCLCGTIRLDIDAASDSVSHCHCKMCQKQHGAAFVTYARFPREKVKYVAGEDNLTSYNSSDDILRKFCETCGSNIEWGHSQKYPDRVGIAAGLFDTDFKVDFIKDLYLDSRADRLNDH